MSEEEKQALTGLCKIEIKRWKAFSESNPNMRYMSKLMEIALASLTAEPEYNTSDAEDVHLDVKKAAYDRCHPDYRWISYPAPPVTVIKPVKLAKDLKLSDKAHQSHVDYAEGYNDRAEMDRNAIRAAGYQVESE
ncbi:MAG: hypothetical protein [Bacteriophage sp.]|nr:MAG: hypothetical protein [Bacteriophage sp.]